MAATKIPVRIIKRTERSLYRKEAEAPARRSNDLEREMKANISGWVREFQQQRQSSAKHAFNNLFNAG